MGAKRRTVTSIRIWEWDQDMGRLHFHCQFIDWLQVNHLKAFLFIVVEIILVVEEEIQKMRYIFINIIIRKINLF